MRQHFSTFTPEAMRAFGQALVAGFQSRTAFIDKTRDEIVATLARFRKEHRDTESERRQCARDDAEGRRRFVSELRSAVQTLRDRFDASSREMAADLREMAGEFKAARDAWPNRPGHQARVSFRRHVNSTAAGRTTSFESSDGARPKPQGHDRPDHPKKRHG